MVISNKIRNQRKSREGSSDNHGHITKLKINAWLSETKKKKIITSTWR